MGNTDNQDHVAACLLYAYEAGRRASKNQDLEEVLLPSNPERLERMRNHPRWGEALRHAEGIVDAVAQTEPRGLNQAAGELMEGVKTVHHKITHVGDVVVDLLSGRPNKKRGGR